jgi:hypothetical protein
MLWLFVGQGPLSKGIQPEVHTRPIETSSLESIGKRRPGIDHTADDINFTSLIVYETVMKRSRCEPWGTWVSFEPMMTGTGETVMKQLHKVIDRQTRSYPTRARVVLSKTGFCSSDSTVERSSTRGPCPFNRADDSQEERETRNVRLNNRAVQHRRSRRQKPI